MSGSALQVGAVTAGHLVTWADNGIIQDGGTAANGFVSSIGILNGTGLALGINSGPITGPFVQFGVTVAPTGLATISVLGYGGAPATSLQFNVNGAIYTVGGSSLGNVFGPNGATSGNVPVFGDNSGHLISDSGSPPLLANQTSFTTWFTTWLGALPTTPHTGGARWWNNGGIPNYS